MSDPLSKSKPISRRFLAVRWIFWFALIGPVAGGVVIYLLLQPTELEREIGMDLNAAGKIDDGAVVRVFEKFDFVTFHQRPRQQQFAIVGIRDGSEIFLAQAQCTGRGRRWRTDSRVWVKLQQWPSGQQIEEFSRDQAEGRLRALLLGYLPRPAGREDFRVHHLGIRISEPEADFDPNQGVDQVMLAELLRREIQYTGQFHLNPLTFAPFHEPRWISPQVGIEELREYIQFLEAHCGESELADVDCQPMMKTLETVVDRMVEIDQLGLKFFLLARETVED
jgi:hypothetical protein